MAVWDLFANFASFLKRYNINNAEKQNEHIINDNRNSEQQTH